MSKPSGMWATSLVIAFVSWTSLAYAQMASDSATMPTGYSWPSGAGNMHLRMPVAAEAEERPSGSVSPRTGDATQQANCSVWSQEEPRHQVPVSRTAIRSGGHGHLRPAGTARRRQSSRNGFPHHLPLISFRCSIDSPDSEMWGAP
jgi:hypothetical protein